MTVEDKTKFLSNLDKDHQAFVSMPHMNAGKIINDSMKILLNLDNLIRSSSITPEWAIRFVSSIKKSQCDLLDNLSDSLL